MSTVREKIVENKRRILYILILLAGIFARIYRFGSVPGGINQDEAFAAREAWSLLVSGTDSFGYPWPMYLIAWGSGMNVCNTILMIPFIAIFGQHTWVFRLPQVIISILTIISVEKIMREIMDEETALWAMFLLAINPWHIMMSRWGLESNLAPGFLIFGLLFFIQGIKNEKYFLLSALFYGISLYCYATIWTIVPFIVLLQAVYLLYVKKAKITIWTVGSGILLGVLAIPAFLFLLVNNGYLREIVTPWFSIPQLVVMRDSEVSFMGAADKMKHLLYILADENDKNFWNSTGEFGLYYKVFLGFALIGLFYCVKSIYKSLKNRTYDGYVMIGIQFLTAFVLGSLIYVNVNRINCIHISIIIFMSVGLYRVQQLLKKDLKYIPQVMTVGFCILFLCFESFYFGDYADGIGNMFQDGMEQAVLRAEELAGENEIIYVGDIDYPKVLAFSKLSPEEYRATVQYTNYPGAYLDVSQCGNYVFHAVADGSDGLYIVERSDINYSDMGYGVEQFGNMLVLYK